MVLVISCCINVHKDVPFVAVRERETRERQYYDSVEWAISTAFDRIVVCENSGYDFEHSVFADLNEKAAAKNTLLEFLSFEGETEGVVKCGKGYGEGEILKYALRHSRLLEDADYFFKLTGRLRVLNIDEIVGACSCENDYFLHFFPWWRCLDTRFYGIRKCDFENLLVDEYRKVNDREGISLENCYCEKLMACGVGVKAFGRYPRFAGVSGTTGEEHSQSLHQMLFDLLCRCHIFNNRLVFKVIRTLFGV